MSLLPFVLSMPILIHFHFIVIFTHHSLTHPLGVKSSTVLKFFRKISRSLYAATPIMLELQYMWMDTTLPTFWWNDGAHANMVRCPYSQLLFTEVSQPYFKSCLPKSLEDFSIGNKSAYKLYLMCPYLFICCSGLLVLSYLIRRHSIVCQRYQRVSQRALVNHSGW